MLRQVWRVVGKRKTRRRLTERRSWRGANESSPRFWPEDRVTVRGVIRETVGWLRALRPVILLGVLIVVGWPAMDPALVEPVGPLASGPEKVSERFAVCGRGSSFACVVDGDTFRLGSRSIRIIGIDAPEAKARCPEEAALAEAATAGLRQLLNAGPFEMVGWAHNDRDRYGRELRALRRTAIDGGDVSLAAQMRENGLARRYFGGLRGGWC